MNVEHELPGVTRGYSIWLEPEQLHYHPGGVAQARALWGPMMRREGGADIRGWLGYAVDPSGKVLEADIVRSGDDLHKLAFFVGDEGLYQLVLENEAGVYSSMPGDRWEKGSQSQHPGAEGAVRYIQRARLPVPVGHHIHGKLNSLNSEGLDIFCEEYRDYGLGDSITLRVIYNGRPLPGASVAATYHFYTGDGYPWQGQAGDDGVISFKFFEKGHWMFTVTYADGSLSQQGENSKTILTSTFVVAGIR